MGCSYIVSRILQSWTFTYFATMISSLLIGLFTYFRVSKLRHFVIMLPISLVIVSLRVLFEVRFIHCKSRIKEKNVGSK